MDIRAPRKESGRCGGGGKGRVVAAVSGVSAATASSPTLGSSLGPACNT